MNKEIGNSASTEQIEIKSHKDFREIINKTQDLNLKRQVENVVLDELALLAKDLLKNGTEPSSVFRSFINIAGTLKDRL